MHQLVFLTGLIICSTSVIYYFHYILAKNPDQDESIMLKESSLDQVYSKSNRNAAETPVQTDVDKWFESVVFNAHSNYIVPDAINKTGLLPKKVKNISTKDDTTKIVKPKTQSRINSVSKQNISTLHAVTYASHGGRDDRFCRAVESAIRHGFKLVILGWGIKWQGLSQKLEAAHSYAKSLPPDDILLFTDAFDVMYTNTPDHVLSEYNSFHTDLIFGAECGCWPHVMENRTACFIGYPQAPTPYRYLNSGTWIGRAKIAANMLSNVIKQAGTNFKNANDQKLVADMYIQNLFDIKLDFYCKLFQSMHMTLDPPLPHCNPSEDMTIINSGHWYNKRTKSQPAVFHFNGGGKTHHLQMENKIWYKKTEFNTRTHIENLAGYNLIVPSQNSGKLRFVDICPDYIAAMKAKLGNNV
eukprot:gene5397-10793_t